MKTPTTDPADVRLRMCRAEIRIETLAAAIGLLCGDEDATPAQRRAAALIGRMLEEAGL